MKTVSTNQPAFDFAALPTLPYRAKSETSKEAALAHEDQAKVNEAIIYKILQTEALNGNEIAHRLGWKETTVRPRISELKKKGKIWRIDKRVPDVPNDSPYKSRLKMEVLTANPNITIRL